jgi:hypothetical protein
MVASREARLLTCGDALGVEWGVLPLLLPLPSRDKTLPPTRLGFSTLSSASMDDKAEGMKMESNDEK